MRKAIPTTDVSLSARIVAVAGVLLLAATACSDSGSGTTPSNPPSGQGSSPGKQTVLGSHKLMWSSKARVEVLALDRASENVIVARLRVVNGGEQGIGFGPLLIGNSLDQRDIRAFDNNSISGLALFDSVNSRLHSPLHGTDEKCLCTRTFFPKVDAGGSLTLEAAFSAPPAGVNRVGLLFPGAEPFLDLPVGNRAGAKVDIGDNNQVDPLQVKILQPRIVPVIATVETDTGAEDELGSDLRVRLSSDVLFALNKADLTPRAMQILREVAQKIDKSPGNVVQVDGHTDNTGNDAINNPLSERRARNVEAELRRLVTRAGVTYQTRGHGSSQPLVPNDTAEGRQANRRVTVTFARPRPASASTPAPSGAGAPTAVASILGSPPVGGFATWPRKANVRVDALRRASNGYAVLTFTVTNEDSSELNTDGLFTARAADGYRGTSTSGVVLVAGNRRYRALKDDRGTCLGPPFSKMSTDVKRLAQNEQLTMTAMFKLPDGLGSVSVELPGFHRIDNLAVS